jgi:hypothetical protein
MKVAPSELNRLLDAALDDQRQEEPFFHALLDSTIYGHSPRNGPPGRQFIQFRGPEGELLLPFFSDRGKADRAAQGKIRVVALQGRDFLCRTLGATLVLDPNDRWCKLYPDEVRQLIKQKSLPTLVTENLEGGKSVSIYTEAVPPADLTEMLVSEIQSLPEIERAYLMDMRLDEEEKTAHWILVSIAPADAKERLARSLVARSQRFCAEREIQFSVMVFSHGDRNDDWIQSIGVSPLFLRE